MNKSVLFGVVLMLIWASAANADTTVTIQPGDRLIDLLRGSGITLGELKDANPGKIPSVCRSTKTVIGRFGAFTLCLRPRSYLVAGRTLTIPDTRAAINARAGQVEELLRTIADRDATIEDQLQRHISAQAQQANSSLLQTSKELGEARVEIEALKRSHTAKITSLEKRHIRELERARAYAKRLRAKIARERGEHSQAEEVLKKALRAAKREGATARVVVKRVPTSSYKGLATGLGVGLAIVALAMIGLVYSNRKKDRRLHSLEDEKRKAETQVIRPAKDLEDLKRKLDDERRALDNAADTRMKEIGAKLSELEKKRAEAESAESSLQQATAELETRASALLEKEQNVANLQTTRLQKVTEATTRLAEIEACAAQLEAQRSDLAETKASNLEYLTAQARQAVETELEDAWAKIRRLEKAVDEQGHDPIYERDRLLSQEARIEGQDQSANDAMLKSQASEFKKEIARKDEEMEQLGAQISERNGQIAQLEAGAKATATESVDALRRSEEINQALQTEITRLEEDARRKAELEMEGLALQQADSSQQQTRVKELEGELVVLRASLTEAKIDGEKVDKAIKELKDLKEQREQYIVSMEKAIRAEFQAMLDRMKGIYETKLARSQAEVERLKAFEPRPAPALAEERPRVKTPPLPIPAPAPRPAIEDEDITDDIDSLRVSDSSVAVKPFTPPAVEATMDIFREPTLPVGIPQDTTEERVHHSSDTVDVALNAYFKPFPGTDRWMCLVGRCEEVVRKGERESHLLDKHPDLNEHSGDSAKTLPIPRRPQGGNGGLRTVEEDALDERGRRSTDLLYPDLPSGFKPWALSDGRFVHCTRGCEKAVPNNPLAMANHDREYHS